MDDYGSLIPPDPSEEVEPLSPEELERLNKSFVPAEHVEAEQQDKGIVPSPLAEPERKLDPADPTMSLANMNMVRRWKVRQERMARGFPANTVAGITREQYVEREVKITAAQIKRGMVNTKDADGNDLDPLSRSRAYAEWRWDAFHRGEVSSL